METLNIYYAHHGERRGPYTLDEIIGLNLPANTLIYYNALGEWTPISDAPVTAKYYAVPNGSDERYPNSTPPPIQGRRPEPAPSYTTQTTSTTFVDSGFHSGNSGYTEYDRPNSYLVLAILSTIFCCLALGIPAIIYASKVDGLWNQGLYEEAIAASKKAKKFAIWSAVVYVIVYGFIILLYAVLLGLGIMANLNS